jgi:hypothetical protein
MARMDELARRYILLCLRLERLVPGFVDSYTGPPELREAVDAEPQPLAAELHDEAMSMRALTADLLAGEGPTRVRGRWMDGQLRSIAAQARRAGGEEISYVDLLEQLFGMPIAPAPEATLVAARERLDAALPGEGSLAERVKAYRDAQRVAAERVVPAMRASAERFRTVTARDFDLPDGEGIDWEEVRDQPWGAEARFLGRGVTRIKVNLDQPLPPSGIAYLAWHEAYPGHHAEHAIKERTLVGHGVAEGTMRTMNTPEAMLAEGQADVAREVVMTNRELEHEVALIGRETEISDDWHRAVEVHLAMADLAPLVGNAAFLLHHDARPEREVRAWVKDLGAADDQQLDHAFRALSHPLYRTYPFTYTEGARLIRSWLETTGQTAGFRRLLTEQLSPAQLLAELDAAGGS